MVLNILIVLLQVVFGLLSRSLALLADAGHNLGDVLGLGLAWGANALGKQSFGSALRQSRSGKPFEPIT